LGVLERFGLRKSKPITERYVLGVPNPYLKEAKADWEEEKAPQREWADYEKLYNEDGIVKAAVEQTIAMSVGVGFETTCEEEQPKKDVDDWCERVGLDQLLIRITREMLIKGNCWTEWVKLEGGIFGLQILPTNEITVKRDEKGNVVQITQKPPRKKAIDFKPEQVIHFRWEGQATSAYGGGMVKPVYATMKGLNDFDKTMKKIMKRYAAPKIVWKVEGSLEQKQKFRSEVQEIPEDEDFTVSPDIEHEVISIDPRGRFENYSEYLTQKMQIGLQTPLLSYIRNATQASANSMMEYFRMRCMLIQRYLKRKIEREIFPRVLNIKEVKPDTVVPRVQWGIGKIAVQQIGLTGIAVIAQAGVLTPKQCIELLRALGLPIIDDTETPPIVRKPKKRSAEEQKLMEMLIKRFEEGVK